MGENLVNSKDLTKYCSAEELSRLQMAIDSLTEEKIKIVNTGMVDSGKSYLYNVLTENYQLDVFPTGPVRTTVKEKEFVFEDKIFIDTPGIDVEDGDDETAFSNIMKADIILMVHNVKTGPINKAEKEWLEKIADSIKNTQMLKEKMIFVCTWKDAREKENNYSELIGDIQSAVFSAVGTDIPFYEVSAYKYISGKNKNKAILCQNSGIEELRNELDATCEKYKQIKQLHNIHAIETAANHIKQSLLQQKNAKKRLMESERNRNKQKYSAQKNRWKDTFGAFQRLRQNLDNLKQELRNM